MDIIIHFIIFYACMKYINVNDYFDKKSNPKQYDIDHVLLTGQAPDKGLFVPEKFVHYDETLIKSFKKKKNFLNPNK